MKMDRRWLSRSGAALFAIALLYPFTALFARIGPWQWGPEIRGPVLSSIRVSLLLTGFAMAIIVAVGTPVAAYIAHCRPRERLLWQALLLVPILLPALDRYGILMTNSATAFVATQVYVGMGYYVLGAVAALDAVPVMLQKQAALLGLTPMRVFLRVTLPLAKLGLAVSLSIAWVRAIGEFGAVVVTAYYPSGMPVQLWVNLESFGLPAVMPLLVVFLAVALPLPWLIHVLAQRQDHA